MALSRQGLPNLAASSPEIVLKGAYICDDCDGAPDLILVATGSEVSLSMEAKAKMPAVNIRVVSMPCVEFFEAQPIEYKRSILPEGSPVMSVEASSTSGWDRYSHAQFGMTTFGASGKGGDCLNKFGFTPDKVAGQGQRVIDFYKGKSPHSVVDRCIVNEIIGGPGH